LFVVELEGLVDEVWAGEGVAADGGASELFEGVFQRRHFLSRSPGDESGHALGVDGSGGAEVLEVEVVDFVGGFLGVGAAVFGDRELFLRLETERQGVGSSLHVVDRRQSDQFRVDLAGGRRVARRFAA